MWDWTPFGVFLLAATSLISILSTPTPPQKRINDAAVRVCVTRPTVSFAAEAIAAEVAAGDAALAAGAQVSIYIGGEGYMSAYMCLRLGV